LESHFEISVNGLKADRNVLDNFIRSDDFPVQKQGKKGTRTINARNLVKSIDFLPSGELYLVLKHNPGPSLRPIEIFKGLFDRGTTPLEGITILKTKQIMG
jgi:hypothetical protein